MVACADPARDHGWIDERITDAYATPTGWGGPTRWSAGTVMAWPVGSTG